MFLIIIQPVSLFLLPLSAIQPAPPWVQWSALICFGLPIALIALFFLFFFIVFPILLFVAALFDTNRLPTFSSLNEPAPPNAAVDAARSAGFILVGRFRYCDIGPGRKQLVTLALSPDNLIAVLFRGKNGLQIKLMSRFVSTRWLVTSNSHPVPTAGGLEIQEELPDANFQTLLKYHQAQLRSFPEPPIPFDPSSLTNDLIEHDRRQTEELVNHHYARYHSPDRSTAKFTLKGAFWIAAAFMRNIPSIYRRHMLARAKKEELEWGLDRQPDQFLITAQPASAAPPTPSTLPPPTPAPQSLATSQTASSSPVPPAPQSPDIPPLV